MKPSRRYAVPDKTLIPDIPVHARVGCTAEERREPQRIFVDLELWWDVRKAAVADDLSLAIDYVSVRSAVAEIAAMRPYALIEAVAERIVSGLLDRFPASKVLVRVRKPSALASFGVPWAGVEVTRVRGG